LLMASFTVLRYIALPPGQALATSHNPTDCEPAVHMVHGGVLRETHIKCLATKLKCGALARPHDKDDSHSKIACQRNAEREDQVKLKTCH